MQFLKTDLQLLLNYLLKTQTSLSVNSATPTIVLSFQEMDVGLFTNNVLGRLKISI